MERRPNFLLINCDDMGYGDLGCYGSQINRSPHVDDLARHGVLFTDFYAASPVCSPSRGALMTGCYPNRIGFSSCYYIFAPCSWQPATGEGHLIA